MKPKQTAFLTAVGRLITFCMGLAACATLSEQQTSVLAQAQEFAARATALYGKDRVSVTAQPLPAGVGAQYQHLQKRITLSPKLLDSRGWQVVLAHELAHHILGHQPMSAWSEQQLDLMARQTEYEANAKAIEILQRTNPNVYTEERAFKVVYTWVYGASFNWHVTDSPLVVIGHGDVCEELRHLEEGQHRAEWARQVREQVGKYIREKSPKERSRCDEASRR